jgi:hypothetical protein
MTPKKGSLTSVIARALGTVIALLAGVAVMFGVWDAVLIFA